VEMHAEGADGVEVAEVVPGKARLASVRLSGDFDGAIVRRVSAASWCASCRGEAAGMGDGPGKIGDEVM
jgi:hypothetical protein